MSRWRISIPGRSPDQTLIDAMSDARELPAEDRDVARAIMLAAGIDGLHTVGDLLDHLAALSPDGRRRLLNEARASAGLEDTETVDRRAVLRAMTSPSPTSPPCAAEGCATYATTYPLVKRWFCPAHEHLASADDLAARWCPHDRH